jgi:YesN/AraC family two-component response regulator
MNCIIIDDEEMARAIIARFITSNTDIVIVSEFSNALQAIKYLNQNKVDLILDIHMPDFGFDFVQTIKPTNYIGNLRSKFCDRSFEYECIVDYLVKQSMQIVF